MESKQVTLSLETVERLVAIADRAGVKQGCDIVGPFDTVVVEGARRMAEKAKESA
jgi:hypothetical protein